LNAPTEPSQTAVPVTAVGSQFEKCNQIFLGRKKNTFVMGSRTKKETRIGVGQIWNLERNIVNIIPRKTRIGVGLI
jgi:hypothetical protein